MNFTKRSGRPPVTLYTAAAVVDALDVQARPGAVAVRLGRVVWAGRRGDLPGRLRKDVGAGVDLPDRLLLPPMVNAHAHLDLTGLGPRPYGGDFVQWLRGVVADRPSEEDKVAAAVDRGLTLSRRAGAVYLGDVAGSVAAIHARRHAAARSHDTACPGVSFLECLGSGREGVERFHDRVEMLDAVPYESQVPGYHRGVMTGLSPHAPYSTARPVYEAAAKVSASRFFRLCTHMAESPAELELIAHGSGPFRDLLDELGRWDPGFEPKGRHPIDHLAHPLKRARWLLAHCNYIDDHHLPMLAKAGASVAYCPIASDYFGFTHRGENGHPHPHPHRHRYLDMIREGIHVCLGTDSILCQPADAVEPLGILPQMRHLYRKDGTDPQTLLKMATLNGMHALELRQADASFSPHAPAIFCSVRIDPDSRRDPLIQALESEEPVEMIDAVVNATQ